MSNISFKYTDFPWPTGDYEDTERRSKRWICVSKRCVEVSAKTADIFKRCPTSPRRKVHASQETSCLHVFGVFTSPRRRERRGKTHLPFSSCTIFDGFSRWNPERRFRALHHGFLNEVNRPRRGLSVCNWTETYDIIFKTAVPINSFYPVCFFMGKTDSFG